MTQRKDDQRIVRTYSLLELTERMINDIAIKTFRSKANVIDLAVAKLHAEVVGDAGDGEKIEQSEPAITK